MEFTDKLFKECHGASLTNGDISVVIYWEKSITNDGLAGIYVDHVSIRAVESEQRFYWELNIDRYLFDIDNDEPTISDALLNWWNKFSENLFNPLCFR